MAANRILALLTRIPGARSLWNRFPLGSVETRVRYGVFDRPHYAYGVYSAADLAKRLGADAISVIEFGVAGGRGLLELEVIAAAIAKHLAVKISVIGFDSGEGMPPPLDYRDLPHVWDRGFYATEVARLKTKLESTTTLILGDIEHTLPLWVPPASVGFIAFDLDYYSSTKKALRLFDNENSGSRLPRVYCYFDDMVWPEHACYNDYTGELCAIREFNEEHKYKKICPVHLLRHTRVHKDPWNEQMYVFHDFEHPLYCKNITPSDERHTQMRL